jgi:DNA-binding NtrC family response regulator
LISATNANLKSEIAAGRFREDLYFRLNVIELEVPPLSQRPDDIRPLAEHFLSRHAAGKPLRLSDEALQALEHHDWSGNVRELDNRLPRAALFGYGQAFRPHYLVLDARALAAERSEASPARPSAPPNSGTLSDVEREAIESALERAQGVVSRAATELGLSRQALYRRMERLGIELERRIR